MPNESNAVAGFGLEPGFAGTLATLLMTCRQAGHDLRISQGLRTPQKQAEYYCRWNKRPANLIDATADKMEADGAPWLAGVLRGFRDIQRTPNWLTSQLPGSGWHQWGLAADCYCYRNGKMVGDGSDPAYKFYADEAVKLGLTAGFYFNQQDSGHVQGPAERGATDKYTWSYIDSEMKARFSDKLSVALATAKTATLATAIALPSFYKDDPAFTAAKLTPSRPYLLPTKPAILRAIAQTYNQIGGLVERLGEELTIDPVAVLSVWYVESGGRLFTPGRPVLRFENHKFFKYWGKSNEATFDKHFQFAGHAGVPGELSSRNHKYRRKETGNWQDVHIAGNGGQDREYDAFDVAERLADREAASLSSSFGGPQIMGFNHAALGYDSGAQLADAFAANERWQVLGFFDFCKSNNLIDEIAALDWFEFGRLYNGDAAAYGPKLRSAYAQKEALLKLPKAP